MHNVGLNAPHGDVVGDQLVVDAGFPYYLVTTNDYPLSALIFTNSWALKPEHGDVFVIVTNPFYEERAD